MKIRAVWVMGPVLSIVIAVCFGATAQTKDFSPQVARILKAPEGKLLDDLFQTAQAVSRNSPTQIDRTTVLLAVIFVRDTKTFIYKYESSVQVDPVNRKAYIARSNCGDPLLKAYMQRGVTIRHQYTGATGQSVFDVKYQDCP